MATKKTSKLTDGEKLTADVRMLADELSRVSGDVKKLVKHGKQKFDAVDSKTKQQVAAAIGALAAILTVRKVAKTIAKARAKKK